MVPGLFPTGAAVSHRSSPDEHSVRPSRARRGGNIISYHKTGVQLTNQVVLKCMNNNSLITHSDYGLDLVGITNISRPTVLFVRGPFSLARSAYFYHRESGEKWLLNTPMIPPKELDIQTRPVGPLHSPSQWLSDHVVASHIRRGESYQSFLKRVPMRVGIRAEYLRSRREYEDILKDVEVCKASPMCYHVCMETMAASTELFKETWKSVLSFLGFNTRRYMDCISKMDLNSDNFIGNKHHATSLHTSERLETKVRELIKKIDLTSGGKFMHRKRSVLGCGRDASLKMTALSK